MEPITIVLVVLGAAVSLLTSLAKQPWMTPQIKNTIAVGVSTVGAVAVGLVSGQFDGVTEPLVAITSVYGTSQAFYQFILKNAGLENFLSGVGNRKQDDSEA